MSANFEELDFRPTAIGTLSLRRRRQPSTGIDIFEIKLGDEFLMSSLFTAALHQALRPRACQAPDGPSRTAPAGARFSNPAWPSPSGHISC